MIELEPVNAKVCDVELATKVPTANWPSPPTAAEVFELSVTALPAVAVTNEAAPVLELLIHHSN